MFLWTELLSTIDILHAGAKVITEVVTFQLPVGMTREELLAKYRATAEKWRQNPDLLTKQYFHDPQRNLGGGVYLWKSMDAVNKWHGEAYRNMILEIYGSLPSCQCFDTSLVVDNIAGTIHETTSPV